MRPGHKILCVFVVSDRFAWLPVALVFGVGCGSFVLVLGWFSPFKYGLIVLWHVVLFWGGFGGVGPFV